MDSEELSKEENLQDKGKPGEDRGCTLDMPPLEQRLPSAEQNTEDKGHTGTHSKEADFNEGQSKNDVTGSKHKAGDICHSDIGFHNSGCVIDHKDKKNNQPNERLNAENQNQHVIETMIESVMQEKGELNINSAQSNVSLEDHKVITEKDLEQKPSGQSKVQPSISPEGPIKDLDQQKLRESTNNMPSSNNEKLHDVERTAEPHENLIAIHKEYQEKSKNDAPAPNTESKYEFREEKRQAKIKPTVVLSEGNKPIVAEKDIVQKPFVLSEEEVQPSVSPEGPIKDIDKQNPNESKKKVLLYNEEKFYVVEGTAENGQTRKDLFAPPKKYQVESNKDTPAATNESNYDVEFREEKTQEKIEPTLDKVDKVQQHKLIEDNPIYGEQTRKRHVSSYQLKSVSGVLFLILVLYLHGFGSMPSSDSTPVMTFLKEFEKLKAEFPGQNEALWLRSRKMLQKHLNKSHPLEPATLILTAAQDGEHTLRCLSIGLARAYATSLNSSWNMIEGPSKAAYDSTTTKLQVDESLSSGFESTCRAAVLHRIEDLPPASLLILYKYCDHENAVFKNVALVLTVLLKQSTLKSDHTLTEVEEQVKDFLWEKCTSRDSGNSYNEMNADKMSGVWSRISHLVLPVFPVDSLESGSCPWSESKKTQN
uniref:Torsin A interacting protein 2 n=1 Tax=Xenopus tropicalis TaxID=8364 RepID=A0A6I8RZS3_XENTR